MLFKLWPILLTEFIILSKNEVEVFFLSLLFFLLFVIFLGCSKELSSYKLIVLLLSLKLFILNNFIELYTII